MDLGGFSHFCMLIADPWHTLFSCMTDSFANYFFQMTGFQFSYCNM